MIVIFSCPQCGELGPVEGPSGEGAIVCPHCESRLTIPTGAMVEGGLERCLVCPSRELFVRKDFPQRLGVAIVLIGFAASSVAWYYHAYLWTYAILFATALIDLVLYLWCGEALQCYRCGAIYRGVPNLAEHHAFNLEVHERHRQQAAREKVSK